MKIDDDGLIPTQKLWARVLEQSSRDYLFGLDADTVQMLRVYYRNTAQEWLYSDSDEPGSFKWACELLEINPDRWRNKLNEQREKIIREQVAALSNS